MLYRKSSPNPPTLLLRIVTSAGASAILGTAACSGTDPVMGSVASIPDSGEPQQSVGQAPPTSSDGSANSGTPGPVDPPGAVTGIVVMPPAGDAGEQGGGGGTDDAAQPDGHGFFGSVINPPDDAGLTDSGVHFPIGVVVGVTPFPDDAGKPDGHGFLGSVINPPDDAGLADAGRPFPIGVVIGVTPFPEDGGPHTHDAGNPCHPCGVVIRPDGG
jgi:hypothetical protein